MLFTRHIALSRVLRHVVEPPKSKLEYTFAMLKPDVANNSFARDAILSIITDNGFRIAAIRRTTMSIKLAKQFYSEHRNKFFYNRLVTFMSSAPIYAMILVKEGEVINSWRQLIGKANVYRTIYSDPSCLRSRFGLSDTRNAVHGSDSLNTAVREASLFFSDIGYGRENGSESDSGQI